MSYSGLNVILADRPTAVTNPSSGCQTTGDTGTPWNDNHTLTEFRNCASCHEPDLESEMFWGDEGLVCTACFIMTS